jgi:hypothetical protein
MYVENEFLISLSCRPLLLLLTHMYPLDVYLSSSSNHQKKMGGRQLLTAHNERQETEDYFIIIIVHSSIHMQATTINE